MNRNLDSDGADLHELVQSIKARSAIKDPSSEAFARTGEAAARIVAHTLERHGVLLKDTHRVLDFGSGSGRVAIPLVNGSAIRELTCVDVDREAIAYLAAQLPSPHCALVTAFEPPLPFETGHFDCLYSVSVWSHLPEGLALDWLLEMKRLLKRGGIALITTAGFNVLEHWRKSAIQWRDITPSDLEREQVIYREYLNLAEQPANYPGISGAGSWGNTLIHPDYIRTKWGAILDIVEIVPGGMNGMQDIVVLRS